jgi:hypothetical protein
MDSSGSVHIFSIVAISAISSCLFLGFCGYALSQRQKRKQRIQLMNNHYAHEPQAHVFTVDVPQTTSFNPEQACSHLFDKHPPSYESIGTTLPGI